MQKCLNPDFSLMVPTSFRPILPQQEAFKGSFYNLVGKSKNLLKSGAIILTIAFIIYCIFQICQNKPEPRSRKKRFNKPTIRTDEPFLNIPGGPPSCPGRWINPVLFNQDNTAIKRVWGKQFIGDL